MENYAIVSSSHTRKALVFIRALGEAKINVWTLGDSFFCVGFWSKFCRKYFVTKKNRFFDAKINRLIATKNTEDKFVFCPMEEEDIVWLYDNKNILHNKIRYLIPPKKSFNIAVSKSLTAVFAFEQGIDTPETFSFENLEEFKHKLKNIDCDNYIVKPNKGRGSLGIVYGSNFFRTDWDKHWNKFGNLLIQERIDSSGFGFGVGMLFDQNSECIARFVHKRQQQFPNSGGPSTDRIGIKNDYLLNKSAELLKKLDWVGFAMVEWKHDPAQNKYFLLEINPRTWGSMALAVKSGVNFPLLYFKLCLEEKVKAILDYKTNMRSKWTFPGDILRFLTQERKKREKFCEFCRENYLYSEELDIKDIRGSIATIVCQFFLFFKPENFKTVVFKLFFKG